KYEQLKSRITGLARSLGYLEGRFEVQRVDVFVPERIADITLRYAAGPRYAFGEVAFDATPLDPEVLESFLSFEAGSDFDSTRVVQRERDVWASEYFAVARVVPRVEQAEGGRIPIDVEQTPTDPVDSSIGIGYSTNDGPRLLYRRENR